MGHRAEPVKLKGLIHTLKYHFSCADPESFVRGGPNLTLFLVDERIENPNTAINRSSSTRQQNAIEMAFRWQADDGP